MVATRCLCCGPVLCPGRSRTLAIFLFITCWMTFIIAEACLLAGSVRNAYHTKYRTVLSANPPSCETLRKGVFGAGAAFVVFTGIVSELYYVLYSKSDEGVIPTKEWEHSTESLC
ncbi:putative modifying wall lignin-1/2 [Helianthus annuus]|nr:putative modifying wall lignin-1/2 [Helianthus annuus]